METKCADTVIIQQKAGKNTCKKMKNKETQCKNKKKVSTKCFSGEAALKKKTLDLIHIKNQTC